MGAESTAAARRADLAHSQLLGHLLSTSALCTAALLALGAPPAWADEIIDNATETVIGTGGGTQASPWNIGDRLFVGTSNTGRLDISAGGEVSNTDGILGNGSGGDGTATVTGAGSIWTNSNELYVGYSGTGELTIANDGTVEVSGPGGFTFVARNSGSTGTLNIGAAVGESAVAAGTLDANRLVFGNGSGTLNFNHTEDYYTFGADISGGGTINQLSGITDLTGDSSGFSGTTYANGGTLNITGTLGGSGGIIGSSAGTTGAVSVLGAGASWTTTTFRVADQGTGTLTIAGGGTVGSGDAWIGNASDAIGTATVTGTGSSLAASNGVDIGRFGTGTLNILDGATVTSGNDSFIGFRTGSDGTVNVSGDGSSFEMGGNDLFVGDEGTGALNVTDGGAVSTTASYIGDDSGSSGEVTVTGSGSKFTNSDNLVVGYEGAGSMNIADGGEVSNTFGWIGDATTSTGTASVDGDGSTWTNSQTLVVGNSGSGALNVTEGGAVSSNAGYVGNSSGADGTVTVDGTGSSWTNASFLTISEIGAGSLSITNGGAVSNTFGTIGSSTGSNGAVTVAGDGSTWTNSLNLVVGSIGTGELTIADGGSVSAGGGSGNVVIANDLDATGTLNIGAAAADAAMGAGTLDAAALIFGDGTGTLSFNHTDGDYDFDAAITGAGTINHLAGSTTLTGDSSGFSGTTMISGGFLKLDGTLGGVLRVNNGALGIENGGVADSTLDSVVGLDTGDVGFATVTGPGSTWTNANDLFVGDFGTGVLTILDGAVVSDDTAYVGNNADGSGTVTVNGTGSSWDHNTMFSIGYNGVGILKVENGGSVGAEDGYVAYQAGSEGTVTVTGSGSIWDTDATIIGDHGTGRITIADGGALVTTNGYLGAETGTGIAMVTGSGSKWTSAVRLVIGDFSTGTMTIADGGVVRSDAGIVDLGKELGANGTLNIGAAAGETAVGAGTLDAEMVQFGQGAGTINFNHTDTDYEFAVDLSRPLGSGTINHIAGVTRLTGDASAFDGTTNVIGGTLYVNNALGGTLNIAGGALGGSGAVGSLTVNAGGALAPGNSIGTLTVNGNLTFAGGSTYNVEVSPSAADRTNATGSADLSGATVVTVYETGTYVAKQYVILNAGAGLGGTTFAGLGGTAPFGFNQSLAYDASNVYLVLTLAFPDGLDANQQSVFDTLGSYFDQNGLPASFTGLSASDLTTLSGEGSTGAVTSGFHASDQFLNQLTGGGEDDDDGADTVTAYVQEDEDMPAANGARERLAKLAGDPVTTGSIDAVFANRWHGWGAVYGEAANVAGSATTGSANFSGSNWGIMGAFERQVGQGRVGLALGGGGASYALAGGRGSGSAGMFNAGLYGTLRAGNAYLSGAAAYAFNSVTTSRTVGADTLSGRYGAHVLSARIEAGRAIRLGRTTLTPYAAAQGAAYFMPGYSETSSGSTTYALTYGAQTLTDFGTELGVRLARTIPLKSGSLELTGRVAWSWNSARSRSLTAAFQTLPGTSFSVAGAIADQNAILVDAGAKLQLADNVTAALSLHGAFSANSAAYGGRVKLGLTW